MPTTVILLSIALCAFVVIGIVGHLAWAIAADRPFAAYMTQRAEARAEARARRATERRRVPREMSGYRGPLRRAADVSA